MDAEFRVKFDLGEAGDLISIIVCFEWCTDFENYYIVIVIYLSCLRYYDFNLEFTVTANCVFLSYVATYNLCDGGVPSVISIVTSSPSNT